MKLLIDTHVLIWILADFEKLSLTGRELIVNPENAIHFSHASLWEIGIKYSLKYEDFPFDPSGIFTEALTTGYAELPIQPQHIFTLTQLPFIHRDPFDRMLVAQAIAEEMTLLTRDQRMVGYSDQILLV